MPAYKEKRGTWLARANYTDWTGQYVTKTKRGFATKREALAWEANTLAKYKELKATFTVSDLIDLFLEFKRPRVKPTTIINYEWMLDSFIRPYLGNKEVSAISMMDIAKWQEEIINKNASPQSFKQYQVMLKCIYNFAEKYYNLKDNPLKNMDFIKAKPKKKGEELKFWNYQQFQKFIECEDRPEYKMLFNTLYWSGMRIGEAMALRWDDIDFERKTIRVDETYIRINGKPAFQSPKSINSTRTIKMTDFYMKWLKDYKDHLFFTNPDTRVFNFIGANHSANVRFKTIAKKEELPYLSIHGLRHSHASYLINMGVPAIAIAGRLGDTTETVLRVYVHLFEEMADEVANKLEFSYQNHIS